MPLLAVAKEDFLDFCVEIDCVMASPVVAYLSWESTLVVPTRTRVSYQVDLFKHGTMKIKVWPKCFNMSVFHGRADGHI